MHKQGFTLIEALVAITILLVGVIGPLGLAAQGIADGLFAKNQIIANHLAQEGIELIINRRDSNIYAKRDWLDGLSDCEGGECLIDALTGSISLCGGAPGCPEGDLRYSESAGVFTNPAGASGPRYCNANFNRTFTIKPLVGGNDNERVAEVKVAWCNHAAERELILNEYLYNYE